MDMKSTRRSFSITVILTLLIATLSSCASEASTITSATTTVYANHTSGITGSPNVTTVSRPTDFNSGSPQSDDEVAKSSALSWVTNLNDVLLKAMFRQPSYFIDDVILIINGTETFGTDWQQGIQDVYELSPTLTVCVALGALLIVLMPTIGCFCCCCRSCNKCGGKKQKYDPKNAKCKRWICTLLLIIPTLLLLACGIVWFLTVELKLYPMIASEVTATVNKVNSSLHGLQSSVHDLYSDNIHSQIQDGVKRLQLAATNNSYFTGVPNDSTAARWNNFTTEFDNFISALDKVTKDLHEVKSNLSQPANDSSSGSGNFTGNFTALTTEIDSILNKLPNTTGNQLDEAFTNLGQTLASQLSDATDNILGSTKEMFEGLSVGIQNFTSPHSSLDTVKQMLTNSEGYQSYASYGRYVAIGIGGVTLFIVLLFLLGLMCGCGERAGRKESCCNKGCGANCMLAGIGLSFLFYALLMLLTMVLFVPGAVLTTNVCWVLNSPSDYKTQLEGTALPGEASLYRDVLLAYGSCAADRPFGEAIKQLPQASQQLMSLTKEVNSLVNALNVSDFQLLDIPEFSGSMLDGKINAVLGHLNDSEQAMGSSGSPNTTEAYQLVVQTRQLFEGPINSSLGDVQSAIEKLNKTMQNLQTNGSADIEHFVSFLVGSELNTTLDKINNSSCSKFANATKAIIDIACVDIMQTFNLLWFSLGAYLAFMIPTIIFGLCLSNLYRREEPYSEKLKKSRKEFDETEGPYGDRDPLHRYERDSRGGYFYASNPAFEQHDERAPYYPPMQASGPSYPAPDYEAVIDYPHRMAGMNGRKVLPTMYLGDNRRF